MHLSTELLQTYRNSLYQVALPAGACVLQIGHRAERLDRFLHEQAYRQAAFVSADNPYSQILPAAINRSRRAALEQILIARKLCYLTAKGYSTATMPEWPVELGFLILGIEPAFARALGRSVGQHAVVFIHRDQAVELLLCREFETQPLT